MSRSEAEKTREPAVRTLAMPADTTHSGDIFGGWIMAQMDIAGGIVAGQRAQGRVATVAVNAMEFHQPVYVGDLASCYADVTRVGRSSITVRVETIVRRHRTGESVKVTEGTFVYVALDADGKRRQVPKE